MRASRRRRRRRRRKRHVEGGWDAGLRGVPCLGRLRAVCGGGAAGGAVTSSSSSRRRRRCRKGYCVAAADGNGEGHRSLVLLQCSAAAASCEAHPTRPTPAARSIQLAHSHHGPLFIAHQLQRFGLLEGKQAERLQRKSRSAGWVEFLPLALCEHHPIVPPILAADPTAKPRGRLVLASQGAAPRSTGVPTLQEGRS